jgi:hypothetical protein
MKEKFKQMFNFKPKQKISNLSEDVASQKQEFILAQK